MRQHRKCRDAHGNAQKQPERSKPHPSRREAIIEKICQPQTEGKGQRDAGVADDDRLPGLAAQGAQIQLHTHHKHEQNQSNLAQKANIIERGGGNSRAENAGK